MRAIAKSSPIAAPNDGDVLSRRSGLHDPHALRLVLAAANEDRQRRSEDGGVEAETGLDLLDADYTFLNERLARHYGIETISSPNRWVR